MSVSLRLRVLLSSVPLVTVMVATGPAMADDAQVERLQKQIDIMQQQLQKLQAQISKTRKTAAAPAPQPRVAVAAPEKAPAGIFKATPTLPGGVKVSVGGFLEAAGIWRQRNEVADVGSAPFGSLPFANSPLYHEDELRFSARQSRLSVKATGDVDPTQHLQGYYEMDFLGAGVTANSRESNSYQPRIRQAFISYDNDSEHFHLLAGQAFSLVTQNKVGELPLSENLPLSIDAQYVAGFNWARQPQVRFVEDFDKRIWLGLSIESPQVNFVSNSIGPVGGPSQAGTGTGGSPIPPGLSINDLNACQASGLLDSATGCSADEYPDIVEKAAFDPGWGHFEVLGLQRFFSDRVYVTAVEGSGTNKTNVGWGVGGSALMPVWPKYVDLTANVLTGQGIGRYGSAQLADVTIGPDGSLQPLTTTQFLVGAIGHVTPDLDVYAYAGQEQVNAKFWTVGGTPIGYGNPAFLNNGCFLENQASGTAGYNDPIAGTTCTANVHRSQELTVGFWQNLYKGTFGRVTTGLQYEYVRLQAFPGAVTAVGTPNQGLNPSNNVIMASLRYYPFP